MPYRYPKQNYRCGLSAIGQRCEHGPEKGLCGKAVACGNGDSEGTADLSDHCRPIRTLVWWKRTLSVCAGIFTASILGLLLFSPRPTILVAPGGLSSHHAQILAKHGLNDSQRCAACHPTSMPGEEPLQLSQSELCLSCHQRELPRATALNPHDLATETLALLTRDATERQGVSNPSGLQRLVSFRLFPDSMLSPSSGMGVDSDHSNLATNDSRPIPSRGPRTLSSPHLTKTECSQCHREHQGADASLAEITSQRCQACHVQRFNSFGDGHPEFTTYPAPTTARIAFDHSKHQREYFTKKQASFDCKECHLRSDESGPVGNIFRSVSFERACSKCHAASLNAALEDGIAWIQLPSFNVEKWKGAQVEIGAWPESASLIDDGSLQPWTRILLASDPEFTDVLRDWPVSLRISDLNVDNAEDRARVAAITNAYRRLIDAIAKGGQKALAERVASGLVSYRKSHNFSEAAMAVWIDQVVAKIPPDLFRLAGREWFGNEVLNDSKLGNALPKTHAAKLASANSRPFAPIRQPPAEQDADDLLSSDSLLATPKSTIREGGDGDSKSNEGDLLDQDLTGSELLGGDSLLEKGLGGEFLSETNKEKIAKPLPARDRMASGGWMLDNERLAIVYVPTGHADPWVSRWIELEGVHDATSGNEDAHASRRTDLTHQCRQCHSQPKPFLETSPVTLEGQESFDIGWRTLVHAAVNRPFTRFNHSPHLDIPALSDCKSCHRMLPQPTREPAVARYVSTGEKKDVVAHRFSDSHFEAMRKEACADCHHRKAAGDQCTKCHNYHVQTSDHALLGDIQRGLAELK